MPFKDSYETVTYGTQQFPSWGIPDITGLFREQYWVSGEYPPYNYFRNFIIEKGYVPITGYYRHEKFVTEHRYGVASYAKRSRNAPNYEYINIYPSAVTGSCRDNSTGDAAILAKRRAVANFRKHLHLHNFNAAMSMLELKDTTKMIFGFAARTRVAIHHFRKLRIHEGFKTLGITPTRAQYKRCMDSIWRAGYRTTSKKEIRKMEHDGFDAAAHLWMEYRYGWRLLYLDVHSAAEAAAVMLAKRPFDFEVKSGGLAKVENDIPYYAGSSTDGTSSCSANVRFFGRMSVYSPTLRSLAALGFTNPAELIWDYIPFSFIGDWALGVESYFADLRASQGLKWHEGTESRKTETVNNSYLRNENPDVRGWHIDGVAHEHVTKTSYNRSPCTSWPVNTYQTFHLFEWLDAPRLLDSLSLLQGTVRGTNKRRRDKPFWEYSTFGS